MRYSDNSKSPETKVVKPPNYLKELRKSKILNKNITSWDKIVSNPGNILFSKNSLESLLFSNTSLLISYTKLQFAL